MLGARAPVIADERDASRSGGAGQGWRRRSWKLEGAMVMGKHCMLTPHAVANLSYGGRTWDIKKAQVGKHSGANGHVMKTQEKGDAMKQV